MSVLRSWHSKICSVVNREGEYVFVKAMISIELRMLSRYNRVGMRQSFSKACHALPHHLVVLRRILRQPALFDLGDISDEGLIARLHDLVEEHPVRFPILQIWSVKLMDYT